MRKIKLQIGSGAWSLVSDVISVPDTFNPMVYVLGVATRTPTAFVKGSPVYEQDIHNRLEFEYQREVDGVGIYKLRNVS